MEPAAALAGLYSDRTWLAPLSLAAMAAALTRGEHLDVMREANGSGKHLLQTGTVSEHNVSGGS
jgi:hypothetical protein